jgi:hypothetical protein
MIRQLHRTIPPPRLNSSTRIQSAIASQPRCGRARAVQVGHSASISASTKAKTSRIRVSIFLPMRGRRRSARRRNRMGRRTRRARRQTLVGSGRRGDDRMPRLGLHADIPPAIAGDPRNDPEFIRRQRDRLRWTRPDRLDRMGGLTGRRRRAGRRKPGMRWTWRRPDGSRRGVGRCRDDRMCGHRRRPDAGRWRRKRQALIGTDRQFNAPTGIDRTLDGRQFMIGVRSAADAQIT